jgi:hypothetical protein
MPTPVPAPGQTRGAYVQACMTDPAMKAKYPNEPARFVACLTAAVTEIQPQATEHS